MMHWVGTTEKSLGRGSSQTSRYLVEANYSTYLCGFVTHASWSDFGGEKDLFAWDARGANRISTRLLISIGASRVNVTIAGAEGMERDGFGHLCGPVQTSVPKL